MARLKCRRRETVDSSVGKYDDNGDCDSHRFGFVERGRCRFSRTSLLILAVATVAFAFLSEPVSAAAWISKKKSIPPSTTTTIKSRFNGKNDGNRQCRLPYVSGDREENPLYSTSGSDYVPEMEKNNNGKSYGKVQTREIEFKDDDDEFDSGGSDDLDSLRAQAEKLRKEAESLQSALQESKDAKLQKETDKIDGWIEDLLIQAKAGDGTELLKTVDQVYEVLTNDRYSAEQVLKIFRRLCDIREQESRSNCSPLMELLVDATGKLDCTERTENPNKRWNHKVERVLRKKLFARDWNIKYVSDDEEFW